MIKGCLESDLNFVDEPISIHIVPATPPVDEISSPEDWVGVPEDRRGSESNVLSNNGNQESHKDRKRMRHYSSLSPSSERDSSDGMYS